MHGAYIFWRGRRLDAARNHPLRRRGLGGHSRLRSPPVASATQCIPVDNGAPPAELREFWSAAYPTIAGEAKSRRRAKRAGYTVVGTEKLPDEAWRENCYGPLRERVEHLPAAFRARAAVAEAEQEMRLFEQFSRHDGYTFYILQPSGPGPSGATPSTQS